MKLKDWPQDSDSDAPSSKFGNNQYRSDKSNVPTSKSSNNKKLSLRMKLKEWPQNSDSNAPSSKFGNDQYRSDKSNVPTSKSSNNKNLSLRMKLMDGFKTPSPMPHHPIPETLIIWNEAEGPASKWPVQCPIWAIIQVQGPVIHVRKQLWFVIKYEAGPKEAIVICHYRQVRCLIIQVQKQSSFVIKNEAGPKA